METENTTSYNKNAEQPEHFRGPGRSGRIFGGLIVVAVGTLLLARQTGLNIPYWVLSWEMLLIAMGVFVGVKHNFRGPVWFILIAVGSVFLLDDVMPGLVIKDFVWPIVIIGVGLLIMIRPNRHRHDRPWRRWDDKNYSNEPQSKDELLDSVNIFGGLKKNIISKNFRGGEITTIFGGSELNLTQADVTERIELEVTQIFGGIKLIVPPHWKIQSEELVSIFGGVDDKRPIQSNPSYDDQKVLVLKGTNIFGGIDIKSY
jgi:hypothetical protein